MAKRTYAIAGATGQIGSVIVESLLKKGHQVRAIGRDPKKLEGLKAKGIEVFAVGGFDKPDACSKAFQGADAAFIMMPPDYNAEDLPAFHKQVGEEFVKCAQKCGLKNILNLSALGAYQNKGVGPINELHNQEERLKALSKTNVLNLRPAFFMENFFWTLPGLAKENVIRMPLKPDLALPMVSIHDIGTKAAELLDRLDFKGQTVVEFAGPRPITLTEATKILGAAINKPDLKYEQVPLDALKKQLLSQGGKPKTVEWMVEMYNGFNEGKCLPSQKLTPDQHGKTTFEQFAKNFANAYKAQAEKKKVTV